MRLTSIYLREAMPTLFCYPAGQQVEPGASETGAGDFWARQVQKQVWDDATTEASARGGELVCCFTRNS